MTEEVKDESISDEEFTTKVRWAIPHRLDFITFVGRDVFAIAHDIYIIFFNFKTNAELTYVANNEKDGDGIDCIAGHRSSILAFAEKKSHPRLFLITYPSFIKLTEIKDPNVNRYKALCMMEGDLIAGFSGFPNYIITVWSWRISQHLITVPTGITRRSQIYVPSRTNMLLCECWGEGLAVWEVGQAYHRCFLLKRVKEEKVGWVLSEPSMVGICWSNNGQLYAIDASANLYCMMSDGIGMVTNLEWSMNMTGDHKPCICAFQNGIIIYGLDGKLRSLKKSNSKWIVAWEHELTDEVMQLVSNSSLDIGVIWTKRGHVYKITGESEDKIEIKLFTYKQRGIKRAQLIAPTYEYLTTLNDTGVMCLYHVVSGKLVGMHQIEGNDISFQASPADPLIAVFGEVGKNYGLVLLEHAHGLKAVANMCLTHQIISQVAFAPTGRQLVAAAMSAGHVFILQLSEDYKLSVVRYAELGRGLADCFMMRVGEAMRTFSLVLFSDKYAIGERIICINADTGKDNKFAGKMQGPYAKLLPLSIKDTMLAIPHLSKQFHILKLTADKGVTVSVKMGDIIESGHDIKYFGGFYNVDALLTYGYDGTVIMRRPTAPVEYDFKLAVSHRFEQGVKQALIDDTNKYIATLAENKTFVVLYLNDKLPEIQEELKHETPKAVDTITTIQIIGFDDKNYLDLQEEKKVREEAMDYKQQCIEVLKKFEHIQKILVGLLEENLIEPPLHQLSLSEFNLHLEAKKERLKQAEKERDEIKLSMEARIRAQDKVTAWIKKQCWDSMLTPRVKLFAIFSHYQVESFAVLPSQRETWPELQQIEALRAIEMENDKDVFRPWQEPQNVDSQQLRVTRPSTVSREGVYTDSQILVEDLPEEVSDEEPYILSGSYAHKYINIPVIMVPQTMSYTYLHMNWLQHIIKLNVQNMRLWFNKQFDELMNLKKREVGLVEERNARLRFIISELNKLSDLRESFHHLTIVIFDPLWRQEEQPMRLIKVDPEECSIEPYISPSQIVVVPPDPGPKDDFRERALMDMMDGVLEKLWHEEIKKPIPKPQCMIDKDPEHFNEDDLRMVFDYEAKVAFRNEERNKYRKMLHAEYAKLSTILNEGIVNFNMKVKEMWLTKLKVDAVIGQENLTLMRLRKVNLDRLEMAEKMEDMRHQISKYEGEMEVLQAELKQIHEQSEECQAAYEALAQKDKYMERTFKNHFADLSPIIVDQCYKFFRKRPKWHQRATMIPVVLYDLANAVLSGVKPPLLHIDCLDYFKGVDQLDQISNMPAVMDEGLWATMSKLRRTKIDIEIRMRALVQELAYSDSAAGVWQKAIQARRTALLNVHNRMTEHRREVELRARNKTIQLVLPAGQVEITSSGRMEDFEDATLIRREDIDAINNVILRVGQMKLRIMRKQINFRRGILAKEWEHAQMKMKLRHMKEELYSYKRLQIPKELQFFLKRREEGYTEEHEYVRMERESQATRRAIDRALTEQMRRAEEMQVKCSALEARSEQLDKHIESLNALVSEKRLHDDPLQPIRVRKTLKKRMETLVARSHLIREVQANHTTIVLLQTELELLRLRTYPTLATFRTFT